MINVLKGSLLGLSLGVLLNASVSYAYTQSSPLYLAADEPAAATATEKTDMGKSEETGTSSKAAPAKKHHIKKKAAKGKKGQKKKK